MRQIRIVKQQRAYDENGAEYYQTVEDYYQDIPDPTPDQIRDFRTYSLERIMNLVRTSLGETDYYKFYLTTRYLREEYLDLLPTFEMWLNGEENDEYGIDFKTTGFPSKTYYSSELRDKIVQLMDESNIM